jgi:hypothetical protein
MTEQIETKEKTSESIEDELKSKLETQQTELKRQVDVFSESTKAKENEEKELIKILNDYKSKYEEFEKAIKKSK